MAAEAGLVDGIIDPKKLGCRLRALAGDNNDGSSPKVRAQVLAILKDACIEGRSKIYELLKSDGKGALCATRISALQDEIIAIIHDFCVSHVYRVSNPSIRERFAVVAVGGYGRGMLAPGSDIDLLFVLPTKQAAWCEQIVEYILYMLWDLGFKVGHATRSIDESIRQAKADMTVRTAILEARFILGDETLFNTLIQRFDREVVTGTASEFIAAKLAERDQRHRKAGNSRYLVEPNVKDGKGGLRDLQTLYWIGKYFYRVRNAPELVAAGMFTRSEYRRFRRAGDFLWTVRCHLHFLTGKAEERLSFDVQRDMAERLNYLSHGGLLDVERFMKHYFLMAKEVGDLTLIVCAQLEEKNAKSVRGIHGLIRSITHRRRKIAGTLDFVNDNGRINVADGEAFKRDPVNMIRMFKLADDNNLDFHPDAIHLLTKSLGLVDRNLRSNPEANQIFLDVLTSRNGPEPLLRRMKEAGLLGKLIPAFGRVVTMMQFNMYHHYTVGEHLIRSVGVMHGIESGELSHDHPLSQEILPDIKDRRVIYVALLLHDIAKGRKEDHSAAGARLALRICPKLGMDESATQLVAWLVQEHLTMSMVAQSRDLSDHRTILDFAETVQTMDRLRSLLILTVCDIRAVGPGVWNGWKGQLLRTLYYETELVLTGGFSKIDRNARVRAAKSALEAALEDWPESDKKRFCNLPYPAYFLSTDLESQVRHMNFLRQADAEGKPLSTMVHTRQFEAITEIAILAPDHPRLLSIITGACSSAGANIADAKIHTTSDGRALDSIFINREFDDEFDEIRRAKRVGMMIEEVLSGKTRLPEMIASKAKTPKVTKAFRVKPSVRVENDLSDKFTVVEVEGLDRAGLLSELTGALADLNLNIGSAHIATFGEKVIDSFYVADLVGHKIRSAGRQQKIIDALTAVLDPNSKPHNDVWRQAAQKTAQG